MKKTFLALFLTLAFMTSSFASNNTEMKDTVDPVIVILTCGGNAVFNDAGMDDEQIFDTVDFLEFFYCEGGSDLRWIAF